ncbi:MAG: hypothetical protein ACREUW_13720 [Burkholderiales bacterium]
MTTRGWAFAWLPMLVTACGDPTPQLTAMRSALQANPQQAELCARAGVLTTQAHELLKTTEDPLAVTHRMLKQYDRPAFSPAERARLETILVGHTEFAQQFKGLSAETLEVAYLQICRFQIGGGQPEFAGTAWAKRLDAAERCEREFDAGERRKECVARAFSYS